MTPGPAVCHHCHSCKLCPPPPRFPSRHLHLCVCLWGEKKTPNICHMINRSTSLQIRGSMSYSVLSECITIPGQAFSVGRWQIGPCIHQWNDKGMFRCFHLSPLSFCSYTRSRCALLSIATGQNTCSTGGVFSALVQEERADLDYPLAIFVLMMPRHAVGMHLLLKVLLASVSNYSETNCYQTKSRKCHYPVFQSWLPRPSWVPTVTAAKSHSCNSLSALRSLSYLLLIPLEEN